MGRCCQRDTEWQSVILKTCRNSDRRIIQQVHEVGVIAEVRIQAYRVGLHLVYAIDGSGGRRDQTIDPVPDRCSFFAQRFQLVHAAECIGRGEFLCTGNDLAHHRIDVFRICIEEFADRDIAFCHPWPFVQQACRIQERGEIDLRPLCRRWHATHRNCAGTMRQPADCRRTAIARRAAHRNGKFRRVRNQNRAAASGASRHPARRIRLPRTTRCRHRPC